MPDSEVGNKGVRIAPWAIGLFSSVLLLMISGFAAWITNQSTTLSDISRKLSSAQTSFEVIAADVKANSALLTVVREEQLRRTGESIIIVKVEERLDALEKEVTAHMTDPTIHKAKIALLELRIKALEDKIQDKINNPHNAE